MTKPEAEATVSAIIQMAQDVEKYTFLRKSTSSSDRHFEYDRLKEVSENKLELLKLKLILALL